MKKNIFFLALLCLHINADAQIRYASSLISFSSEYGGCWSATETLGAPNADPNGGCNDLCGAWAQASEDGIREYLELEFEGPAAPINKVMVWENYSSGAIDTIFAWNYVINEWVVVMQRTAVPTTCIFPAPTEFTFTTTSFAVDRIRIAQNSPAVPSWNEIDAIGILDTLTLLPVTGLQLKLWLTNKATLLKWQTSSESNSRDFEVLRSNNGIDFNTIGSVAATGNTNSITNYNFTDFAPLAGNNYYQIRQTDIDNRFTLSEIKRVSFTDDNKVLVFPNPFKTTITLQNTSINTTFRIMNLKGQTLIHGKLINNEIYAPQLAKGVYVLELISNGSKQIIKLIKD